MTRRAIALTLGAIATMLGAAVSLPGLARATVFDTPATSGDRRISLSWQPDADDPAFTGNTFLDVLARYSTLHGPGHRVQVMVPLLNGADAVSWARGDDGFVRWRSSDGSVLDRVPLGVDDAPTTLSLHAGGRMLLATLESGGLAIWNLDTDDPPVLPSRPSGGAFAAQFVPSALGHDDLRFAVATGDGAIAMYDSPGTLAYTLQTTDGPAYAVAFEFYRGTMQLLAGGRSGRVRLWDVTTQPLAPRWRFDGHLGPVTTIAIAAGEQRAATADSSGNVRIWDMNTGSQLASFDVDASAGPPFLSFSIPGGDLLYVLRADGRVEFHDGRSGARLRDDVVQEEGSASLLQFPDGRRLALDSTDGEISVLRVGRCVPNELDPICFGGYKIWRSPSPDPDRAILLRTFNYGDSSWSFAGEVREFSDPDSLIPRTNPPDPDGSGGDTGGIVLAGPHNGMPYFYSVTRFDRRFLNGSVGDQLVNTIEEGFYRELGSVVPSAVVPQPAARTRLPLLEYVIAVPNPYVVGNVPWEFASIPHVEFRNLPARATIRLYTMAGDHVRTIEHDLDRFGAGRSAASWDFKNSSGRDVASGVYLYQVETPSGEVIQDYFTFIR